MRSARQCMVLCVVVAAAAWGQSSAPAAGQGAIEVRVDPRVELLSLVFRLAGNPEYNMDNSASPYADEIDDTLVRTGYRTVPRRPRPKQEKSRRGWRRR